jgi:HAD superfamily hydrolase (TIGR01509 family)
MEGLHRLGIEPLWQHGNVSYEPLRALLVDVGGTLVDDATWLTRQRYEALRVTRLREAFGTDHPWFGALASHPFAESDAPTWEQRTAELVMAFLTEQGVESSAEDVERICRAAAAPLSQVVELADGARPAVQAIRELGVPMVICSNTLWRNDADSRRDWEELGFGAYFDGYVTSHDTGFGKPHPAIFERALAGVGATPSEAAIIGDRPDLDVAGARAVGMRSIWMRPSDFEGEPDPSPDADVHHWADVPPIIERWLRADDDGSVAKEGRRP